MADRDGRESDDGSSLGDDPIGEGYDDVGTGNGAASSPRVKPDPSSSTPSTNPVKPIPLQKRRRVTRACDCCRRKKIKCDGLQPCTHCSVYSYECTYDQPSNRRRNPTPQYIEALEGRLQRLDTFFKLVLPDADLDHPSFEAEKLPQLQQALKGAINQDGSPARLQASSGAADDQEGQLETMVEATGRLDIDESGRFDFHGHSSGFAYLNKLKEQLGDLLGTDNGRAAAHKLRPFRPIPQQFSSNVTSPNSSYLSDALPLPPREVAKELSDSCLTEALLIFRFIHRPSFDNLVDRLYGIDFEDYKNEEHLFLPVFYLVLAIGCVFTRRADQFGILDPLDEGGKYFTAGRRLTDITDCRDVTSLQCVLLMIIFLQSSAKLATCYSYVGIAVGASFRLGLHRKLPFADPVQAEVRKRIFCTVQKMDISVSALIGLPRMIHDEDIDPEWPTEVEDEHITKDGISPGALGQPNGISASNAHTKLLLILGKVVKKIYPVKGLQTSTYSKRTGYMISYAVVREIEQDLTNWQEGLPAYLRKGEDVPNQFLRTQYTLQVTLAHVKMMLYRPFIHYVAQPRDGRVRDERPFASAAACINTCREIIHICQEMKDKGILNGAYWYLIYTTFFSVVSLLYFVLENVTHSDAPAVLRDATVGKDCIFSLKDSSVAGDRCSSALKPLFDQLPNRLREGFGKAQTKKRGRAVSPAPPVYSQTQLQPTSGFSSPAGSSAAGRSHTFPATTFRPGVGTPGVGTPISLPDATARRSSNDNPLFNHDMLSPAPTLGEGQEPKHSLQQHLGGFTGMPDLNALMFPASGTFAYGSQAMMFDASLPAESAGGSSTTRDRQMSGTGPGQGLGQGTGQGPGTGTGPERRSLGTTGSPSFDNVEVQLYGPLPPYVYSVEHPGTGFGAATYATMTIPVTAAASAEPDGMMFDAFNQMIPDRGQAKPDGQYSANLGELLKMGMTDDDWDPIFGNPGHY
ncbi:hypothetical protein DRE_01382 [Drechslerella stenobrocha 248]|uniref:Zn(2)-C6 fungal-type domain-containing protein n=1 Tax=Drechslerella stenobrocha 248 TaxID=1043628 RepID=W7I5L6_9PEZI|nr:hypothetical protein DRE_01382 [Drechslerella stenobrocha 248]